MVQPCDMVVQQLCLTLVSVCLLLFFILATSKVISGWAQTCDSAHSSRLYTVASVGDQATITMTQYPTQSHYPDTESTSPWPILLMPSPWQLSIFNSFVWLDQDSNVWGLKPLISQNWRWTFYSFGHHVWSFSFGYSSNNGLQCTNTRAHIYIYIYESPYIYIYIYIYMAIHSFLFLFPLLEEMALFYQPSFCIKIFKYWTCCSGCLGPAPCPEPATCHQVDWASVLYRATLHAWPCLC